MTENDVNPADKELAALNAELDTLTADLKAALDQQATPPGGKTGIERAADLLAKAGRLVQEKLGIGEQRAALERYAQAMTSHAEANARWMQLDRLGKRAARLSREIDMHTGQAKNARYNANEAMNARLHDLQAQNVPSHWIDAIRNSLSG